jgi:hypothetical protein
MNSALVSGLEGVVRLRQLSELILKGEGLDRDEELVLLVLQWDVGKRIWVLLRVGG